jgi:hypothetical protein
LKNLGAGNWLDESGRLYITQPAPFDPFGRIGAEQPNVLVATPFAFEDVPTYGLFGAIYRNNPLHFASHETAVAMRDRIAAILSHEYLVEVIAKEQTVGPFRRGIQRDIRISRGGDLIAEVNAGQETLRFAKEPSNYPALVLATVAQAEQR